MSKQPIFRQAEHDAADLSAGAHLASTRFGTPGNDHFKGGDDFDMSQGGNDRLRLDGGDDTVYFGDTFTGADRVFGGKGFDTVTLDGDYSDGIEVGDKSLQFIETLILEGGSYDITGELNFKDQFGLTYVDAHSLTASQPLSLNVATLGLLLVSAGAGDDIIHASANGQDSELIGNDGDDTLIGGTGASRMGGDAGADTIVMANAMDIAFYDHQTDSRGRAHDTIENFAASGGRIELTFDSDTSTEERDHDFHFGKTADRTGDILVKYDAQADETILKVFTDADHKADLVVHLTGDVPLTPADFIFG